MMNLFDFLFKIAKRQLKKVEFINQNKSIIEPAIFVANHEGSFGPIAAIVRLPFKVKPWIISDMMDIKLMTDYMAKDFFLKELHIGSPFNKILSKSISRICIKLFNYLDAIPVYQKSQRIIETIAKSIICLESGENIIIFPEIQTEEINDYINRFNIGFIKIAHKMEKENGKKIPIYPLAISKKYSKILLGEPSFYMLNKPYLEEKTRLQEELENKISNMLMNLEKSS